jgi:hypothetical protein
MTESPLAPDSPSSDQLEDRLDAERRGLSFLIYRDTGGIQQVYTLDDTPTRKITIGRDLAADILLAGDSKVSGMHAELEQLGEDWVIVDDGLSRNGTFVNADRVQGRRRLKSGDEIRVGGTTMLYQAPDRLAYGETVIG